MADTGFPDWGIVTVGGTPTAVTSGAASATVAIPNDSSGNRARYVRISVTGFAHVMPVQGAGGSVTATTGVMVSPNNDIFLNVRGYTHIAYIQEAAAAKISIVPLEV